MGRGQLGKKGDGACAVKQFSAMIRKTNAVRETESMREIKTCDDLFHKEKTRRD